MGLRGRRQIAANAAPVASEPEAVDGEVMPIAGIGQDIPPHVWHLLQQAGELAAGRLVEILQSPAFKTYAPSAQRGLIELALTRAYGLPIRKALNLNLSTNDADAVAQSLADLAANLPENGSTRGNRGALDVSGGQGSRKP